MNSFTYKIKNSNFQLVQDYYEVKKIKNKLLDKFQDKCYFFQNLGEGQFMVHLRI